MTSDSLRQRSLRRENALLEPSRHPVRASIVAVATIVVLTAIGFVLRAAPFDEGLVDAANIARTGLIGHVAETVYEVLKPVPAIVLTLVATAAVWAVSRRLRTAAAFVGTVALTWVLSDIVKLLVDRPRPDVAGLAHHFDTMPLDASFPSGHVVFVTALTVTTVVMLRGTAWQVPALIAGIVLIVLMAASVVVDGVHYPTDALAAVLWVLGVFSAVRIGWATIAVLWAVDLLRRRLGPRRS